MSTAIAQKSGITSRVGTTIHVPTIHMSYFQRPPSLGACIMSNTSTHLSRHLPDGYSSRTGSVLQQHVKFRRMFVDHRPHVSSVVKQQKKSKVSRFEPATPVKLIDYVPVSPPWDGCTIRRTKLAYCRNTPRSSRVAETWYCICHRDILPKKDLQHTVCFCKSACTDIPSGI